MYDEELAQLAIRNRAATLVVATTGTTTLAATAEGYTRDSGSFLADRFRAGMEVTPAGFPQTAIGIIDKGLSATVMPIVGGRTISSAEGGRSLVSGLPAIVAYENIEVARQSGRPYVTEEFTPGPSEITTWPTDGGRLRDEFLSIWTWYGLAGAGIGAIKRGVHAFKLLFAAGTILPLDDGTSIRVRGDTAVRNGQLEQVGGGWAAQQIVIPFRVWTRNTVPA